MVTNSYLSGAAPLEKFAEPRKFQPSRIVVREQERQIDSARVAELASALAIPSVVAKIMLCRGIDSVDTARAFLQPSLKTDLVDPSQIKNIGQAVQLLLDAVEQRELITIYCDFDVDGLTSASQLYLFLRSIGAQVNAYAPSRFTEGYGLVRSAVEKLATAGTKLLLTVDCGITSHSELVLARRLGMKTVVLDHHEPHGLPPADVVVDPAQEGCPFQQYRLCAAGLSLMLIIELRRVFRERWPDRIERGEVKLPDPKDFLDLAALGTICDMVPLTGLNRLIAHRGLESLKRTNRAGLVALKAVAGIRNERLSAGSVGFGIGPRINAAGRLSDARDVIDLLTTGSESKASAIASKIDSLNSKRKMVEDEVLSRCLRKLRERGGANDSAALVVFDEGFHLGVIGIVAQRLVERFHRPSAVLALGDGTNGAKVAKGSVRSIPGFHVARALESVGDTLMNHGGHAEAGGFTVALDRLDEFSQRFVEHAGQTLTKQMLQRQVTADAVVELGEIDYDLVSALGLLGPFGIGNPTPLLVSKGVTIESVSSVSTDHLKFRVSDGDQYGNAIAWRFRGHPLIKRGEIVNLAYSPEINTYQGISTVQLNVKEVWEG